MTFRKSITLALGATTVIMGVAAIVTPNTASAAEIYSCPARITSGVTNAPRGWRSPSSALAFRNARIQRRGNTNHMICTYGRTTELSRPLPVNRTCRVSGRGFGCTVQQAQAPTPPVFKRGSVRFVINQTVDMDNGIVGAARSADMRSGPIGLSTLGSARFSGRVNSGGYQSCNQARKTQARLNYSNLPVGSRFCMTTGSGRLTSMVVTQVRAGTMVLNFRTWR